MDQLPLPFVNNMDTTYEEVGAKRVAINQRGPSLSKRQATGQACFRGVEPPPPNDPAALAIFKKELMRQPPPCIIFRGTGSRISQEEKDAYPEGLVVLWQKKAWVDRPLALLWAEKVMKPFMDAERAAGVADASSRYLLFQDNLDAQKQQAYLDYLRDECQLESCFVPPNKTDQVQPVDRGFGQHIKLYMGQEMDEWLEDEANLERW